MCRRRMKTPRTGGHMTGGQAAGGDLFFVLMGAILVFAMHGGFAFLEAGAAGLKSRARDDRDETIDRLRTKVGELTMDTELLQTKIARLEAGGAPFAARRSKR